MNTREPIIIVALDVDTLESAKKLLAQLNPKQCRIKIGKTLFTQLGPDIVRTVMSLDFDVFLDLKFHDIPNTVAGAVKACADLGVWMCDVHTMGGERMMDAAREALLPYGNEKPLLIGVTVLTSLLDGDLQTMGISMSPAQLALQLARQAQACGFDGVVSSAWEASSIRQNTSDDFIIVTPGIRPEQASSDDQTRVATPSAARKAGSDYLVIGRPITRAPHPQNALAEILSTLSFQ